jgi:hypothetical protein
MLYRTFDIILNFAMVSLHQSGLARSYWLFAFRLAVLCLTRVLADKAIYFEKGFPLTYSKLERLFGRAIVTQLDRTFALKAFSNRKISVDTRQKFFSKLLRASPSTCTLLFIQGRHYASS